MTIIGIFAIIGAMYALHRYLSYNSARHLAEHDKTNALIIERMIACDAECATYIAKHPEGGYYLTDIGWNADRADIDAVTDHLWEVIQYINDCVDGSNVKWWRLRSRALVKVLDDIHTWGTFQRDCHCMIALVPFLYHVEHDRSQLG